MIEDPGFQKSKLMFYLFIIIFLIVLARIVDEKKKQIKKIKNQRKF